MNDVKIYFWDSEAYRRHIQQCAALLTSRFTSMVTSKTSEYFSYGEWYYDRFIAPTVDIALQKGIDMAVIDAMIDTAYEKSTDDYPMGTLLKDAVLSYGEDKNEKS